MARCRQCGRPRIPGLPGIQYLDILSSKMNKIGLTVAAVILAGLVATVVFLATWDIPAPTARVEKVIPNDRLPR